MNVLVTGGAGYIGSHTCKMLQAAGHRPVAYDNLCRGNDWAVRWCDLVRGDIGDCALVESTLRQYEIQAILHFAAFGYVGESIVKPVTYFENNSVKTFHLLQAAERCGVRHLVFSSTCATYGNPVALPIAEEHPQSPINPYGESKLFVEQMLHAFGTNHGLRWVALRYFNAGGADPAGEIGECHHPETHLIPLVLQAAADAERPIHIFGSDFPTPDGTAIRDYVHVSDLAQAHVQALDYLAAGGASRAFNLGTGQGYSVAELLQVVERVTGRKPAAIPSPRRPGDPAQLVANASQARAELGWIPRHSSLAQIVEDAWQWYRSPRMDLHRANLPSQQNATLDSLKQ